MSDESQEVRALAAALAVADANGVASEDAVILAGGSNVLVHLKPAPVIARVMTGTALLHEDIEQWLGREVALGAYLGGRGLAVPPSHELPPGPHQRDGFWMTFWEFVEHEPSGRVPRARELGAALGELHAALADFPGALGPLSDVRDWLDRLLPSLDPSPTLTARGIGSLRSRLQDLTPTVFESPLPAQAIHGDASMSNLLRTTDGGLLWSDLEDACVGPVHWDVAGLVTDARERGESDSFVADFLDAYGRVGLDELNDFIVAHHLYTTAWRAFQAERRAHASDCARRYPLP